MKGNVLTVDEEPNPFRRMIRSFDPLRRWVGVSVAPSWTIESVTVTADEFTFPNPDGTRTVRARDRRD
jgi:hypothetical protein